MKIEFSGQIFKKNTRIKFYEHLPSGSRVVPHGQTGRHDEAKHHSFTPRRYNPCRVLADSRSRLQWSLSLALALQFL